MTIFATSDWRALCSELNQWVVELAASHPSLSQPGIAKIVAVTDRADTALAQSELKEAKGSEIAVAKTALPVFSNEEIDELWDQESGYFALYEEARRFARALIALAQKTS